MRNILSILLALLFLSALPACQDQKPVTETQTKLLVRRNAHSTAAQADLEAMSRGLDSMRALPCTDPRSWYYQGAIHSVPNSFPNPNPYCGAYQDSTQLMPGWDACPHMKPGDQQLHFLAWHRLYIYYYEQIIRKYSGKADFALPYWDYGAHGQRTLPDIFRDNRPGNGLYESDRSRLLLSGQPLNSLDSDAIVMNIDSSIQVVCKSPMEVILDTGYLWTATDIHHFSYELEDGCHNCMHDYIGGAVNAGDLNPPIPNRIYQVTTNTLQGLMADVPSAGFDPIFFLHHANLDRLWMQWEHDFPAKAMTEQDFLSAGAWSYLFFNANGDSIRFTSMEQVWDSIRAINYTYDYLQKRPTGALVAEAWKPFQLDRALAETKPAATPLTGTATIKLPLSEKLTAPQNGNLIHSLEIEVSFKRAPNSRIAVSVLPSRPAGSREPMPPCDDHLAGIAGFFGAEHDAAAGGHDGASPLLPGGRRSKIIRFDINDELSRQKAFDADGLMVAITPLGAEADNPLFIERVTLRRFRK